MKRTIAIPISIGLLACALSVANAEERMFRWVDKDGKVHYSDKKPEASAKDLQTRKVGGNVVETSAPGYALSEAMNKYPVTLYTADNCKEPCQRARETLSKRGVPFTEIAVRTSEQREQLQKASGDAQVPVLMVGKEMRQGFEVAMYNAALDSAGYPQTAQPGTKAAKAAPHAQEKKAPAGPPKGQYSD